MREAPSVLAETEDLLVVNKPAGLIVHSDGRTEEPSLAEWIREHYPVCADVGEPWVSPQGASVAMNGIVHRLDRTTSGVMLVAKTNAAYTRLKQAFKDRVIEKTYRALVYGHPAEDKGVIVAEIIRTKDSPRRWAARPCEPNDPRAALTDWCVLKRFTSEGEPVSYIEARPRTGRTHQIRVHFASIGNPIIADHLYAPDRKPLLNFTRPALHAYEITVLIDGVPTSFIAPLPPDFAAVDEVRRSLSMQ
jgi:23S rRNA pseudouridine1911/1915/1917 synthase